MSLYIYQHPEEAYEDELKVIAKTYLRRKFKLITLMFLIIKAKVTYWYRYVRLLVKPK